MARGEAAGGRLRGGEVGSADMSLLWSEGGMNNVDRGWLTLLNELLK